MSKRLFSTVAVVLLSLFASVGLWADTTGTMNDNISWTLTDDGTLTITGSGDMPDFGEDDYNVPWYRQRRDIKKVVVGEGITKVGNGSFCYCQNMSQVLLPESLTAIGDYAFYSCKGLTEFTLPASLEKIGSYGFQYSSSIKRATVLSTTPPTCGDLCFEGVAEDCTLYVPSEGIGQYVTDTTWRRFSSYTKSLTPRRYAVQTLDLSIREWVLELHYDCNFNASHFLTYQFDALPENFTVSGLKAMIGSSELYTENFDKVSKIIIEEGFENYLPTSCKAMFAELANLKTIEGLERLNTTNVTDMSEMFNGCHSLEQIDLSSFNTAKVTSTDWMFNDLSTQCEILVGDGFTVNGVTTSDRMFGNDTSAADANYTTGLLLKKVGTLVDRPLGAHGTTLTIDNLALADGSDFTLTEAAPVMATAATYSRTMKNQWGTLCLPYPINTAAEDTDCRFYGIESLADDVITLKTLSGDIAAGTPVVFCLKDNTTADKTATITGSGRLTAEAANAADGTHLVGTFHSQTLPDGSYFIANDHFYKTDDHKAKTDAYRAYIVSDEASAAAPAAYSIAIGDTTISGIGAAEALEGIGNGTAEYYNAGGMRIGTLQKGLNVVKIGGRAKKVLVK